MKSILMSYLEQIQVSESTV